MVGTLLLAAESRRWHVGLVVRRIKGAAVEVVVFVSPSYPHRMPLGQTRDIPSRVVQIALE